MTVVLPTGTLAGTPAQTAGTPAKARPEPAGTHREVEIKLDADAGFVLPDLTGLPGVTGVQAAEVQELDAVYLDSSDLRLIRHGTTFRRRSGGTDAGWHLKLPAAKRGRIEVQRPAGASVREIPPGLLGLVRVQLRGAPVGPVARISTHRTVRRLIGAQGVVLAEVADDQVVAEAMGAELTTARWREIEVELVDGDDDLLAHAATALISAGARGSDSRSKLGRALAHRLGQLAPPATGTAGAKKKAGGSKKPARAAALTAGEVAVRFLSAQVEALIAEDPQVRIDTDDAVHQMRVATRRLRTALATFRPLFADRAGEPLRVELKWLAELLGVARDAEVMRARLTAEIAAQPAELVLGPVQRRVDVELGHAYRQGHAAVIEALDGERYLALVLALEAFVASPPLSERAGRPAATELRLAVRKACRRVQHAAAGLGAVHQSEGSAGQSEGSAGQDALDHHLHEVRIAAKRARYAAEAVRPVIGKPAKAVVDAMEQVQETLGDHQDAVVERGWLRDLAVRAFLAGENGFTFGRLHGLADARAQHDQAVFGRVWADAQRVLAHWPA